MLLFGCLLIMFLAYGLSSAEDKNAELQSRIDELEEELEEAKDQIFELENKEDDDD